MKRKIKVVADNKIPFLKGVLEPYAEIIYLDPSEIKNEIVRDKDALIIRTRTVCDEKVLDGTNIKFIATATIGLDHIDVKYCNDNNIQWINAPGCNSSSVMQYIASALVTIAQKKDFDLSEKTIGIIGVGHVGSKVVNLAKQLKMKVLLYDPPRMRNEGKSGFVNLDELISASDIISLHVPLNKEGIDKTFHMCDDIFFNKINSNKILINTSRGSVIKTSALKNAIRNGIIYGCILDVWENEPYIDKELIDMIDIGTPHIAGYSADGKANGTAICVNGFNSFFNLELADNWYPSEIPPPNNCKEIKINCINKSDQDIIKEIILATYNIDRDNENLRRSIDTFEKQRAEYPIRREFPYYNVNLINGNKQFENILSNLGFKLTLKFN